MVCPNPGHTTRKNKLILQKLEKCLIKMAQKSPQEVTMLVPAIPGIVRKCYLEKKG